MFCSSCVNMENGRMVLVVLVVMEEEEGGGRTISDVGQRLCCS